MKKHRHHVKSGRCKKRIAKSCRAYHARVRAALALAARTVTVESDKEPGR